jgi:hypothetical protein
MPKFIESPGGARMASILTGIPVAELKRDFDTDVSVYDDKIVDLLHFASHALGVFAGAVAVIFLYWMFYNVFDFIFFLLACMYLPISLWFKRKAILAQYFKLKKAEEGVN